MVVTIPPLMIFSPAMFALGVQIAAAGLGLGAKFAMMVGGTVESGFRFFNCVLAL